MIDITRERCLSFTAAAAHLSTTATTIYRWTKREKKPLESVKIGGKRVTTLEALRRFADSDFGNGACGVLCPSSPIDPTGYAAANAALNARHF